MMRRTLLRNNIAQYRSNMNLSQAELGNLVCVSKNAISSFERGKYHPSAYTAALICKVFNCTFEDLFYLEVL